MHYEGVRRCRATERERILEVINAAAVAYRGVIPDDCWREPYMPASELDHEIAADVAFWGYDLNGSLIGVMGIQPMGDELTPSLLRRYWSISDRQIATSTVLANPAWHER